MNCTVIQLETGGVVCEEFLPLLKNFELESLDEDPATIYGIRRDHTIAYLNATWFEFGRDNDAPDRLMEPNSFLGQPLGQFLSGPMEQLYTAMIERVVDTREAFAHDFECSSPNQFRYYHHDILPLPIGDVEPEGILLVNSPAFSVELPARGAPVDSDNYVTDDNLAIACSNCRRFRRADDEQRWDWVPDFLEQPPADVSHSLCTICLDYYYSMLPDAKA